MDFRTIKKCNFNVSTIGLGCEHLEKKSKDEISAVVRAAVENGINILDVFMPQAEVRENIGFALNGIRDKVYLQGHIGAVLEDGQYKRTRDLNLCKLFIDDFLKRYQTDYIDIGMVHFVDTLDDYNAVINNGIFDYALSLKKQGKVRAIGLSSHDPVIALKAVESGIIDVLLFSINPAYDLLPANTDIYDYFKETTYNTDTLFGMNKDRAALYAACEKSGVGITVMKALGAGQLLDSNASPFGLALTVAQCIHYALCQPGTASVMVGCKTPEEVLNAIKYNTMSNEEKDYSTILKGSAKYSMNGRCMYCNHCLPCPSNIDIATVTKYLYLAQSNNADEIPATIIEHYKSLDNNAQDCIKCGSCESNCPFGVKIIENMEQALKLFK